MGAASFTQTSFLGGEWSPLMQGRFDLPKYRTAMNVCLNIIPMEEGAAPRRSGTQQIASTRSGANGRIIGYTPVQNAPYLMEFTDGHLRFYSGYSLVLNASYQVVTVDASTPAKVHLATAPGWVTGDQIEFVFAGVTPGNSAAGAYLRHQQFMVTSTADPLAYTLTDPISGAAIDGALVGWTPAITASAASIVDLPTPWTSGSWANLRWIPFSNNQGSLQGLLLSSQQPQLVTVSTPGVGTTSFAMAPVQFVDGPYLDPIVGAIATPSGGTVTTTYSFTSTIAWQSANGYRTGDIVNYDGAAYYSISGGYAMPGNGTNKGNIPSASPTDWTLLNYNAPYPAWVAGQVSSLGTIVTYNGSYFLGNGYTGHGSDYYTPPPQAADNWNGGFYPAASTALSGPITLDFTFTPWISTTVYTLGQAVSYGLSNYVSLVDSNLGNIPSSSPTLWQETTAGAPFGPNGVQPDDVGRLIRLFYQPPAWSSAISYAAGNNVTYEGAYYNALVATAGAIPSSAIADWQPVGGVAFWTPAIITVVNSQTQVVAQILGAALSDTTPIVVFSAGAYTNTNNVWPTCGCYHQGRLWLSGALPNRWDASTSDDPLAMTPTAPDGTVSDNNGISAYLNSDDNELIQWMRGTQQGVLVGTLSREWLINASSTADPITPSTAEVVPITHYGSAFVEPKVMGLATVFVQKFKRKLMEMVANVFSGKYNAPNLALTAKHLTQAGIEEIAYQEELAPVIWARMGDGTLAGCTYRRISAFQTDNPVMAQEPSTFAGWHQQVLGSGRSVQSITTTLVPDGSLDQLAMVTRDTNGVNWVEVMMPLADTDGNLFDAWFLDSATTPTGSATVSYGGQTFTRFYGLKGYVGNTVSVWAAGLDCGDYVVGTSGYVDVPYGAAGGLYTQAWITENSGQYANYAVPLDETVTPVPPATTQPFIVQGLLPNTALNGIYDPAQIGQFDFGDSLLFTVDNPLNAGNLVTQATGARLYGLTNGLVSEIPVSLLSLAGGALSPPSHGYGCLGLDGHYYFIADSYLWDGANPTARLMKLDLNAQAITGVFGTLNGPTGVNGLIPFDMSPMTCGGATYIVASYSPPGFGSGGYQVIKASTMAGVGSGTFPGTGMTGGGYLCRGHVGTNYGSLFAVGVPNAGNFPTTVAITELLVNASGALTTSFKGNLPIGNINPAWTNWGSIDGFCYDPSDGNLIIQFRGSDTTCTIAKINPQTSAVLWSWIPGYEVPTIHLRDCRVTNGRLSFFSTLGTAFTPAILTVLDTKTGQVQTSVSAYGCQLGGNFLVNQVSDSTTGIVGAWLTPFALNANEQPATYPGTPRNFTGWALLTAGNAFKGSISQTTSYSIPVVIGTCYPSQGQIVRPATPQESGSKTGPAQGETRRLHMMSALLYNTQGISFGTDFQHLAPAKLSAYINGPTYPLTQLFSGVYWDTVQDTYSFDGMLCWQVTRPYPATVVNIGGWVHTQER